jgi:dynein heavy chain 1, cytosolic
MLDSFVDALFTPAAYNVDFDLVPRTSEAAILSAPDGTKLEHFMLWAQGLPDRTPPSWLSLPPTAERVIAEAQGTVVTLKFTFARD